MTDPTVVFKVRREVLGDHVHLRVFAGPDADHLALTGELVMDAHQAWAFEDRVARAGKVEGVVTFLRSLAFGYRDTIADLAGRNEHMQKHLYVHLSAGAASLLNVLADLIAERRW